MENAKKTKRGYTLIDCKRSFLGGPPIIEKG